MFPAHTFMRNFRFFSQKKYISCSFRVTAPPTQEPLKKKKRRLGAHIHWSGSPPRLNFLAFGGPKVQKFLADRAEFFFGGQKVWEVS